MSITIGATLTGNPASFHIACADEKATIALAQDLATILKTGDCLLLVGDLGAGKSTFARAALRALAGDSDLDVPSPTYTLVQTYDLSRLGVAHIDLYRLEEAEEIDEIGLDDLLETGAVLVEWPERAEDRMPKGSLVVRIAPGSEVCGREITLSWTDDDWEPRLDRTRVIRAFLKDAGWEQATRIPLQGDASSRAYETIVSGERKAILMNAPERPDGPPVRDGLPYSRLVHLAEDVRPFVAIGEGLRKAGFSAPELYAADLKQGILLLEDLGREGIVADGSPITERYEAAVDLLADLHAANLREATALPDGTVYRLPRYDERALLIEAELYLDWYLPENGLVPDQAMREEFVELWKAALANLAGSDKTWVLRDYHSPNLIWRGEKHGHARIGLIDFQDALWGPGAYDVGSLLFDARVTVPAELETALFARYCDRRRENTPGFDAERFARDYAILSAQRLSKVTGIFVRLARRDGKPRYLAHLPRIFAYMERALSHPALAELKAWYEAHRLSGRTDE